MKKNFSNALLYTVQACVWTSLVILRLTTLGYFPTASAADTTAAHIDLLVFYLQLAAAIFSVVSAVISWVHYRKERTHSDDL